MQDGKKTIVKDGAKETVIVKKVFVTLYIDTFKFRQKKIFGCRENEQYKALFVCTCCEKIGKTVSLLTRVVVNDLESKEDDEYELLEQEVHHFCQPNGVENYVHRFKSELFQKVRDEPTNAIPSTYVQHVQDTPKDLLIKMKKFYFYQVSIPSFTILFSIDIVFIK